MFTLRKEHLLGKDELESRKLFKQETTEGVSRHTEFKLSNTNLRSVYYDEMKNAKKPKNRSLLYRQIRLRTINEKGNEVINMKISIEKFGK